MSNCVRWENVKEGMFRIVDSIALANLWATVKGNKSMNYEKLSRAMRSVVSKCTLIFLMVPFNF